MSRNICHGVPLALRIKCRALRLLARTEMSHLHQEIVSFPNRVAESLYITLFQRESKRDRPRPKAGKHAASSILARKDPRRAWRRSGSHRCDLDSPTIFPRGTGVRLSLVSWVICPSFSIFDVLDASKSGEHLRSPESRRSFAFYIRRPIFVLYELYLVMVWECIYIYISKLCFRKKQ